MARIIICGGNGAGKSTLGKALACELGWKFADIEDYYFTENNTEYNYETARTKEEVTALLLEDMRKHTDIVLAAVKGNYGEEAASMFDCAIFISVPKEFRMKRVWERSYQKFGDRMLPGGDLYEKEKRFFNIVEKRSENDVEEWLSSLNIPVIKIDGTQAIEKSVMVIRQELKKL